MTFKGVGVAISAKPRHFMIAVMTGLCVVVPSQPASAQNILLDFATASLNTLFNRSSNPNNNRQLPPQPVPNSNSTFGTGNMNGNNINFCVFPCVPNGTSPAASRFVPTIPSGIVPNRGIVTQQRIGLPPGVAPNRGIPTQQRIGLPPGVVPNRGIPTQRPTGLPPGTVTQQPNRLPPGVVPNRNIPTQQPNPRQNRPRPTIIIPPITLPFSL
ncbi:MAG: hypothetical protein QNJ65_12825 [Xenococcaceae cyanobacterium MO_234.B1]|nr:hypothetical protein [Xenococcaceae cyanobacterium MO_234.B1]